MELGGFVHRMALCILFGHMPKQYAQSQIKTKKLLHKRIKLFIVHKLSEFQQLEKTSCY